MPQITAREIAAEFVYLFLQSSARGVVRFDRRLVSSVKEVLTTLTKVSSQITWTHAARLTVFAKTRDNILSHVSDFTCRPLACDVQVLSLPVSRTLSQQSRSCMLLLHRSTTTLQPIILSGLHSALNLLAVHPALSGCCADTQDAQVSTRDDHSLWIFGCDDV